MDEGSTNNSGTVGVWKATSVVLSLGIVVLSSLLGWVCFGMVDVQSRIIAIEASRFTVADARAMENNIRQNIPPKWFKDMVVDNKRAIERYHSK